VVPLHSQELLALDWVLETTVVIMDQMGILKLFTSAVEDHLLELFHVLKFVNITLLDMMMRAHLLNVVLDMVCIVETTELMGLILMDFTIA